MSRWTRTNLLLGMLAGVLAVLYLWPNDGDGLTRSVTTLTPDTISSLRVERGSRLTLALQRDNDGWRLTHPQQRAASARRVNQLLAIALADTTQCFELDNDLQRYGLGTPAAILQLDGSRLAFGDRDPTQRSRYVLIGDEVCVIDDLYFNLLTLPAKHFAAD